MSVQEIIWNYFLNKGFTPQAISGIMGNIDKECDFLPNRVQINNLYTDAQYTAMVDNGTYQNFPYDQLGYGIVQWTYSVFKQDLLTRCKNAGKSISDLNCQLEQLYSHLQSENVLNKIKNLVSVEEATKIFMLEFEKPRDQSEEAQLDRIERAKKWFNIFQYNQQGGNNSMKYSQSNPPLMCMMTHSTCYQQTSKMQVRGVLWHSTGANNKTLKRYVQPSREDPNYTKLMMMIGQNTGGNDWNSISVQAGLNAWIGTLADGTVAAVQTMPWDYKPWGCGSGANGSCNNGWIQFEICEDSLGDPTYFAEIYKEACELTAYLCKAYNINPLGNINGVPTILCHQDSYRLGLGTNHSDVYHWFSLYGKTMDDVRQDVANLLGGEHSTSDPIEQSSGLLRKGMENNPQVKAMQQALQKFGYKIIDDGDFGPATENALKDYQQKYGLTPNGIFGPETFVSMRTEIAKLPKTIVITNSKYNDVMLGSSSKDENGNYSGGQGGDQTGKEVYILNWYGKNWTSVLRPKDSALAERIATACEKGCLNDNIGYSQSTRNTLLEQAKLVGLDLAKISSPCNCDCSSFVSTCCVCAGLPESLFFPYGNGCTTWTIADACLQSGQFTQLTDSIYLNQKNYLKRGDILLNRNSHVVIVLSNGSAVPVETIVQEQQISQQDNIPYLIRVMVPALNVRMNPSSSATIVAQVRQNEVYTIVAEEGGFGKLKSGVGWIDLRYTQKK